VQAPYFTDVLVGLAAHAVIPGFLDFRFIVVTIGIDEDNTALVDTGREAGARIQDSLVGVIAVDNEDVDRTDPDLVFAPAGDGDEAGWVFLGEVPNPPLAVVVLDLDLLLVLGGVTEGLDGEDEAGAALKESSGPRSPERPDLQGVQTVGRAKILDPVELFERSPGRLGDF
jgi:hypothetical protein